jgi:hypothetical protein
MTEEWRTIRGLKGHYQVSNFGNVRSVDRYVNGRNGVRKLKGKMLVQHERNGYAFVCVSRDGNQRNLMIHRAVAFSFIGSINTGQVVHHKDGNKLNNHVDNLEITSKQKNTQEYYKTLGKSTGKVPISDIAKIQERVLNGEQVYEIAKEYSVTRNDIAVLCKIVALTGEELELKP